MKKVIVRFMLLALISPLILSCNDENDEMIKNTNISTKSQIDPEDDENDPPKEPGGG